MANKKTKAEKREHRYWCIVPEPLHPFVNFDDDDIVYARGVRHDRQPDSREERESDEESQHESEDEPPAKVSVAKDPVRTGRKRAATSAAPGQSDIPPKRSRTESSQEPVRTSPEPEELDNESAKAAPADDDSDEVLAAPPRRTTRLVKSQSSRTRNETSSKVPETSEVPETSKAPEKPQRPKPRQKVPKKTPVTRKCSLPTSCKLL